jgi:hypothetical protein
MSNSIPTCRTIEVFAFSGDRSLPFAATFQKALDNEKHGRGPGPTSEDCLLFAGHTGVSTDGTTIYGFNPDASGVAVWEVLNRLRNGEAYPGIVRDDTRAFVSARSRGLVVLTLTIIFPDPLFRAFETALDGERRKSQYSYGFPNGDGDCNCVTWIERIGLPLLTGRLNEFTSLPGITTHRTRRFGRCV